MKTTGTYTAFAGARKIAAGALGKMLRGVKAAFEAGRAEQLLIFEDATGAQVDFDLRGTLGEVLARVEAKQAPGPGRPRLGVVCREVSLLPRHWEWLERQRGGASAALRTLVDAARARPEDAARIARDATSRILTAMAGNLPGYEEACRALFAPDHARFRTLVRTWPKDLRTYLAGRLREIERLRGAGAG